MVTGLKSRRVNALVVHSGNVVMTCPRAHIFRANIWLGAAQK